jgi:hypothetical protein
MRVKRVIAALAVLTVLTTGVGRPQPARAADFGEIATYAGIAIGVWVVVVLVATAIVYRRSSDLESTTPGFNPEQEPGGRPAGLRAISECPQSGGTVTLACW